MQSKRAALSSQVRGRGCASAAVRGVSGGRPAPLLAPPNQLSRPLRPAPGTAARLLCAAARAGAGTCSARADAASPRRGMLPRTKYNRFRNDSVTSVDDLLHNLSVSGGGKVSAARAAPAAAPYLVSGDALRRAPDDGPGSLGHLLHKVSHLKLSSSGLRGLSAARERAGARLSGSCSAPSLAAPDGSAPPGPRAPAMRAARKGRPGDEPPPRAPHANDQVLGAGVTYVVKVGAGAGDRVGKPGHRGFRHGGSSWRSGGAHWFVVSSPGSGDQAQLTRPLRIHWEKV